MDETPNIWLCFGLFGYTVSKVLVELVVTEPGTELWWLSGWTALRLGF